MFFSVSLVAAVSDLLTLATARRLDSPYYRSAGRKLLLVGVLTVIVAIVLKLTP
jgi:hypothetical protein